MKLARLNRDRWADLARRCRISSPYQDPRFLELIETVYPKLTVHRLACDTSRGDTAWLLPLVEIRPLGRFKPMLISLPFGNYGGFMFPTGGEHLVAKDMLSPLEAFFRRHPAFALEIRSIPHPGEGFQINESFKRFEVVFPDSLEVLWKKVVSGNVRTSVRKADHLGVRVEFHHKDGLRVFQRLHERHARRHGTPEHHADWYPALMRLFGRDAEVVLASHKGRYIAAVMLLYGPDTAVLHAAVADPDHQKIPATEKLIWAVFEKLVGEKKLTSFDFGRTRPDKGKLFFKRKWGGRETPIYYAYWMKPGESVPCILPENPAFDLPMRIWRRMPMPLTRWIGPHLRVRIPT